MRAGEWMAVAVVAVAAACGGPEVLETATGQATFYSDRFEGRETASGTQFSQADLVAAHRRYPFGTEVRVTNLRNAESVHVRIVDRGPFSTASTIIDLSRAAAAQIGLDDEGRVPVEVAVLAWGDGEVQP